MRLPPEQLALLIEKQAASLRSWIRTRCSSPDDVVQEAFCLLASQDPPPSEATAWLYRVCRNLSSKQRRSDARRRTRETARAAEASLADCPSHCLEQEEMLAAVDRLEPDLREIVIARIWGQLTLEEVGRICDISTATAHRRYREAIHTLRTLLSAHTETPT